MTPEERTAACEGRCVQFVGYGFTGTQRELVAEAIKDAIDADRARSVAILEAMIGECGRDDPADWLRDAVEKVRSGASA